MSADLKNSALRAAIPPFCSLRAVPRPRHQDHVTDIGHGSPDYHSSQGLKAMEANRLDDARFL